MNSPEVHCHWVPEASRVDFIIRHDGDYVKNMLFANVPEGQMAPTAMSLSELETQALMDRLWRCGFRPTEGTGSAGSLRATEKHLEDMRTIAFDSLGIKDG